MKKVFGICDLDKSYVEVLSRYISRKEGNDFNVVGFSKAEALAEFTMHEKFDVLLISVSFIEEMNTIPTNENVIPEKTFILTEENEPGGFKFPEIYKYQSTERILLEITRSLSKSSSNNLGVLSGKKVIGVYSVIGRCGKTSLAVSNARKRCDKEKTLLLSFDVCPADEIFETTENRYSVSDLLYSSAIHEIGPIDSSEPRLYERIEKEGSLDIITEVKCSRDVVEADAEEVAEGLRVLALGDYAKIIVDVGNDIKKPEAILEVCDEIIFPCLNDEKSLKKIKRWEREIIDMRKGELLKKVRKISVDE